MVSEDAHLHAKYALRERRFKLHLRPQRAFATIFPLFGTMLGGTALVIRGRCEGTLMGRFVLFPDVLSPSPALPRVNRVEKL